MEAGDRIAVANFNGTSSNATVLDEEGGVHPDDGEELLDVRFDNDEEFLIRYSFWIEIVSSFITLPKIIIAPENGCSWKENSLPTIFQPPFFGGYASFREYKQYKWYRFLLQEVEYLSLSGWED